MNRIIRIVLLFFTSTLFIVFFVLFSSSYRQYENIQSRTKNILKISQDNQESFDTLYQNFNNTEHYFRLFSLELHKEDYIDYEEHLALLSLIIDTLIADKKQEIEYDKLGLITQDEHQNILNHYLILKTMMDSVIVNSKAFKTQPNGTIKIANERTDGFVGTKNNLATLNSTASADKTRKSYTYENLKKSLSILQKEEKKILAKNFSILYSIDEAMRDLREEQIRINKGVVERETQQLFAQSVELRSQTILCLVFMFVLICIIVYYQFFTSHYERKLFNTKKYANKLAEEKSDLFTEIAHEIRTPINALIGILDLLKKKKNLYNTEDRLLVESAYTNITYTSKTINDILNLSTKDSLESKYNEFDMEDVVQSIIEVYQSQAKIKNIALNYIVAEDTPTLIYTDEFKIRQIITNLISNAIKYSAKGKVNCTIQVDSSSYLKIEVTDEGIGIPLEMQQNLFKKYYTAEVDTKYSNGIGLGLFITKKFVLSLKGKITFKTSPENGTTFNVEIPIPAAKHRTAAFTKYQNIHDLPSHISLLIVDDNALNVLYLKQFFTGLTEVWSANNSLEALEIIKNEVIDLVITDINMPIMSGDELLVQVRSYKEFNSIKLIATSSDNKQVKKLEVAHSCYFDGILTKPFNEKDLVRTIVKTLKLI